MHLEYFAQQKLLPLSNLFFAPSRTFLRWAQGHGLAPEAADHPDPEKVKVTRERDTRKEEGGVPAHGSTSAGRKIFQVSQWSQLKKKITFAKSDTLAQSAPSKVQYCGIYTFSLSGMSAT